MPRVKQQLPHTSLTVYREDAVVVGIEFEGVRWVPESRIAQLEGENTELRECLQEWLDSLFRAEFIPVRTRTLEALRGEGKDGNG